MREGAVRAGSVPVGLCPGADAAAPQARALASKSRNRAWPRCRGTPAQIMRPNSFRGGTRCVIDEATRHSSEADGDAVQPVEPAVELPIGRASTGLSLAHVLEKRPKKDAVSCRAKEPLQELGKGRRDPRTHALFICRRAGDPDPDDATMGGQREAELTEPLQPGRRTGGCSSWGHRGPLYRRKRRRSAGRWGEPPRRARRRSIERWTRRARRFMWGSPTTSRDGAPNIFVREASSSRRSQDSKPSAAAMRKQWNRCSLSTTAA